MATKTATRKYTAEDFTATQFHTAAEKAKFTNDLIRFIDGGFKGRFTKSLYQGLHCSGYFSFIAHYNIHGFHEEKFSTEDRQQEFLADLERASVRDMHTGRADIWADVKTVLVRHYQWCPF